MSLRRFIVVLVSGCALSAFGFAASLGELRVDSALGEPFRASVVVRTAAGEQLASSCFRVASADDVALLGARLSLQGNVLQIRSSQPVNEPMSSLVLRMECPDAGVRLYQREYTLLLDPREYRPRAPQVVSAPPVREAAPVPLAPPPSTSIPEAPVARAQRAVTPRVSAPARETPPVVHAPAPLVQDNRLVLGQAGSGESSAYALQLSAPVLDLDAAARLTPEQADALREQLLRLDADDLAAQERALEHRTRQMEKRVAALRLELEARQQAEKDKAQREGWLWWLSIAGGVIGLLVALVLVLRWRQSRVQREQEVFSELGPYSQLALEPAEPAVHAPRAKAPASTPVVTAQGPLTQAGENEWSSSNRQMDVVLPGNVSEEVSLLLEHGLVGQAVATLRNEIDHNPTALALWMRLFDVYAEHGWKDEFAQQAVAFRQRFYSESLWQQVQELGRKFDADNTLYHPGHEPDSWLLKAGSAALVPQDDEPVDSSQDLAFARLMQEQAGVAEPEPIELAAAAPLPADAMLDFNLDLPAVGSPETRSAVEQVASTHDALDFQLEFEPVALEMTPAPAVPTFVSDDAELAAIASRISAGQRDLAVHELEEMLYRGTLEQKLTASRWLDQLLPQLVRNEQA